MMQSRILVRSDKTFVDENGNTRSKWYSVQRVTEDPDIDDKQRRDDIIESNKKPLGFEPDHSAVGYERDADF